MWGSFWDWLALQAEVLHHAGRASEALEAIGKAETLVERTGERWYYAELQRLGGVFLAGIGGDDTQFEASFCDAIETAKWRKSASLAARSEAAYQQYRSKKTKAIGDARDELHR